MIFHFIKIIFTGFIFLFYSYTFANELDNKQVLQDFLTQMTEGKSLFCMEHGILTDGLLVSDYQIQNIHRVKNNITMTVRYTEVGQYFIDEAVFKMKPNLYKSSISKTAQYSFLDTSRGLQITGMNPDQCLLLYNQ